MKPANSLLSLFFLATTLSGCASTAHRARYDFAREHIAQAHEKAFFGPTSPWLTSQSERPLKFSADSLRAVQEKYFAVTGDRVSEACREHFLACLDPLAFEFVVRSIHNSEILDSKTTKLRSLEQWADGELPDQDFLSMIGLPAWPELKTTDRARSHAFAARP